MTDTPKGVEQPYHVATTRGTIGSLKARIAELESIGRAVIAADERGQGLPYAQAMDALRNTLTDEEQGEETFECEYCHETLPVSKEAYNGSCLPCVIDLDIWVKDFKAKTRNPKKGDTIYGFKGRGPTRTYDGTEWVTKEDDDG